MTSRDEYGRFSVGHIESPEEKLKRISSMRDAWKTRKDFIGDLREKCPQLYNIWRGFMFTVKGKKIGHSKEWEDYRTFFNDVFPSYSEGKHFRRPDITKPFSKENFVWVGKEDLSAFKSNSIYLTYEGETLLLSDWALKFNISLSGLRLRYHRYKNSYSVEEILFGRKKKRYEKRPKDVRDDGVNIRAKASKMLSQYRHKDKKMGVSVCDMDIEWMIENIFSKPCVYCGDTERIGADRILNSEGHTKSNVVPCCYECNCARNSNFSYDEMLLIGKTIAKIKSKRDKKNKAEVNLKDSLNTSFHTYQYDLEWNLVAEYSTAKEAADKTGFLHKSICSACRGIGPNKHHRYKDYYWLHEKKQ